MTRAYKKKLKKSVSQTKCQDLNFSDLVWGINFLTQFIRITLHFKSLRDH